MASRGSRRMHRAQQSSRTVPHSDGSEAKDCQELLSIRLVRSRQWRSKSRVTRKILGWEKVQRVPPRSTFEGKKYVGNGIKIVILFTNVIINVRYF